MPLLLSSRSVDALIAHCERHNNYDNLFGQFDLAKGIRRGRLSIESLTSSSAEQNTAGTRSYTAIQIEANESTPLLLDTRRKSCHSDRSNQKPFVDNSDRSSSTTSSYKDTKTTFFDLRFFGIVIISVTGLFIASYLLITETRLPSIKFSLDLVSHDIWSKTVPPLGALLNHSKVTNVVVAHTGGKSCATSDGCVNILREMQAQGNNRTEVPFNFLIGDDGLTYEVRGWDHENGLKLLPKTSMLIGFIGNYTKTVPSETQLQSALSLIRESIKRKKLQKHYKVYGLQNLTVSYADGEALFNSVAKWTGFDTLRHVL